jgi:hypothetical protein
VGAEFARVGKLSTDDHEDTADDPKSRAGGVPRWLLVPDEPVNDPVAPEDGDAADDDAETQLLDTERDTDPVEAVAEEDVDDTPKGEDDTPEDSADADVPEAVEDAPEGGAVAEVPEEVAASDMADDVDVPEVVEDAPEGGVDAEVPEEVAANDTADDVEVPEAEEDAPEGGADAEVAEEVAASDTAEDVDVPEAVEDAPEEVVDAADDVTEDGLVAVPMVVEGARVALPAKPPKTPPKPVKLSLHRRSFAARFCIWSFDLIVVAVLLIGVAAFALPGRDLPAPDWVANRIETRLSAGLQGASLDIGKVAVRLDRFSAPKVSFQDVSLKGPQGSEIIRVPVLQVGLSRQGLMAGRLQPRQLTLPGAQIVVRRDMDGRLNLGFGTESAAEAPGSIGELLDQIDMAFTQPGLAPITSIQVSDATVVLEDARAGRSWTIEHGALSLEQDETQVEIRAGLRLPGADAAPTDRTTGAVEMTFTSRKGSHQASLAARVTDVAARDIALQSPAFAFLQPLDAPVSGSMRANVDTTGAITDISGQLEIGAGSLQPGTGVAAIPFNAARTYFRYDPAIERVTFDELYVDAAQARLSATGHAYIEVQDDGFPNSLVAQIAMSDVFLDPDGMFTQGAQFQQGAADLRVRLNPFQVEIGQALLVTTDTLRDDTTRIQSRGKVTATEDGWRVSLDSHVDEVSVDTTLALWPLLQAPRTRQWLSENLIDGTLYDGDWAMRFDPVGENRQSLNFRFREATVRAMRTLPPIQQATGYGTINNHAFTLQLDEGITDAPVGGTVDLAGSVFRIEDIRALPTPAEVRLKVIGGVPEVLSLLDRPPMRVMERAGRSPKIATGQVVAQGVLSFPLKSKLQTDEVRYDVVGKVFDAQSDQIVPERVIQSAELDLRANNDEVSLSGAGAIEGIPVRATWIQPLGGDTPSSSVTGNIELSQAFVDRFNIGLPDGMVSGAGVGQFEIALESGKAPAFSMTSDLNRMGLRIAELAWSIGRSTKGSLQVEGELAEPPILKRLSLNAPGLKAEGSVTLLPGGGLNEARFSRVVAGQWIDAPVTLSGRGKGAAPAVRVSGGRVDIRKTSFAQGGSGSTAGGPITLALDRLVISDGITLRDFRAELNQRGGLNGSFRGSVNGSAPLEGQLAPGRSGGTAVRIQSDNAGRVFRAAGLFDKGTGGVMDLTLVPRAEPGQYDGTLKVKNTKVQSAPGLAAILNTISVIGLLDQLNGPGLLFTSVDADFRLTPNFVQVRSAAGTGPSVGLSMAGIYDMTRDRMDMQGVLSPLYILNGVGQLVSRRGEGLFGFNYRMTGSADGPKVAVNPLSVLTPGVFREIFRRPPPELGTLE